tara:strand:+ start:183 stop:1922 length:1740 start_codon:yes stop_codon:yes gene_type:complete
MISSSHLNKILFSIILLSTVIFNIALAEEQAADIWDNEEVSNTQAEENDDNENIKIKSPILSSEEDEVIQKINENEITDNAQSVIGIFDPEENNFNLNMWSETDGEEIKKVLQRVSKLKLSKLSEDLLYQVLFTNAYPPKNNLGVEEFLNLKINWLIKKKRIEGLENLLKKNPEVGKNSKVIKFLINEYLSSGDIKLACDKIEFIDPKVKNDYLEKFIIYCLINNDRKEEAQLVFDLFQENSRKDKFFEDKINFLLGVTEKTTQNISDKNLLNFYFSHITSKNFEYQPTEKTDKYIWRYLSSVNLIQVNDLENEEIILRYEQAAAKNTFNKDEIFKIYLRMNFNFNQLVNAEEIYKNLPSYKARALVYQSILLSDGIEKKISLALLLKDLFAKDKILNIYTDELSDILKSIDINEVPENYVDVVNQNLDNDLIKNIKYNNDILHRSKVIKHFLSVDVKKVRTEKDFKSVYKKIKRNKKYFISIKDIIVLESLAADGISLPEDLDYTSLASELNVPKNLEELARGNQIGLVMLKIVEIIGEDNISDLDPETIYFLNKILNNLNLKKIRNNILSEALPNRV